MPRPRTVSDDAILDAAERAMGEHGPLTVTLADIGARAGISPAGLVQRYGTKRALLLAVVERSARHAGDALRKARARTDSPLEALVEGLVEQARDVADPEEVVHHLAFLQLDLRDPEFGERTRALFDGVRDAMHELLDEAIERRDLHPNTDAHELARLLETTYNGALLTWAVRRHQEAKDATREAVEGVLALAGAKRMRRKGKGA